MPHQRAATLAPIGDLPPIAVGPLAPGAVDLWCFFYQDAMKDEALSLAYLALLSEEERAQHRRFHFDKDRVLFLATRALVRTVLSRYGDTAPADWRFDKNAHGKPFVARAAFEFNLSNTRGLVTCAVASMPVGVDTEDITRDTETLAIADRFFSESEVGALRALPEARHRERFFSYWTLKESYIKARGMGLAIPLGSFGFDLDGGDIRLSTDRELDDDGDAWRFRLLRASERHYLAVGARCDELSLRASRCIPLRGVLEVT